MSHEINISSTVPLNDREYREMEETDDEEPPWASLNKVDPAKQKQFENIQGSLMVVAVLAAGASYQAGLNPPGGFWQANDDQGHKAGKPVLQDTFPGRYTIFFCCNGMAFIMSLLAILFLMDTKLYEKRTFYFMEITMALALFSFMGAYAAGSSGEFGVQIYLYSLMGMVTVYMLCYFRLLAKLIPCY